MAPGRWRKLGVAPCRERKLGAAVDVRSVTRATRPQRKRRRCLTYNGSGANATHSATHLKVYVGFYTLPTSNNAEVHLNIGPNVGRSSGLHGTRAGMFQPCRLICWSRTASRVSLVKYGYVLVCSTGLRRVSPAQLTCCWFPAR